MHSHLVTNFLCLVTILFAVKVVRTQAAQDPIQLSLTPALLHPIVISDTAVIFPTNTFSTPATSSLYPYAPGNSFAPNEKQEEGLSSGAIFGIIIAVALFLIGCILLYRWNNKSKSDEENPLLTRMKQMREAALKPKDSIKRSIVSRSQPTQPIQKVAPPEMERCKRLDASKRPAGAQMEQKPSGLTQPSLYAAEHEILDSMDLPILPANLTASERVRIIIDTLRKSRGPKSRPSTPMAVDKPAPQSESTVSMKMGKSVQANNAPSIPSIPIPFITSAPPPASASKSVPDGYRPVKPHTRPNKKNSTLYERSSLVGNEIINMKTPFKEEIDIKVSSMIENVLSRGNFAILHLEKSKN